MGRKRKDTKASSVLVRLRKETAERLESHGRMHETYSELTDRLLDQVPDGKTKRISKE